MVPSFSGLAAVQSKLAAFASLTRIGLPQPHAEVATGREARAYRASTEEFTPLRGDPASLLPVSVAGLATLVWQTCVRPAPTGEAPAGPGGEGGGRCLASETDTITIAPPPPGESRRNVPRSRDKGTDRKGLPSGPVAGPPRLDGAPFRVPVAEPPAVEAVDGQRLRA